MSNQKLADDLTELETQRAALITERDRAAGEMATARARLANTPDQRNIDAATVTQSRHAALESSIVAVDEQIVRAKAALALAESEESARSEQQRLAELRVERDSAQNDFNAAWEETHAVLLEHIEKIQQHRTRFIAASEGLRVRTDLRPPELLLNNGIHTALGALAHQRQRERDAVHFAESARQRAERTAADDLRRQGQAEAARAERAAEEARIARWQSGDTTAAAEVVM